MGARGLLVLLLAMPVSGWLMSSAGGVSVRWFGVIDLPDLVPRDPLAFTCCGRCTTGWPGR